MRLQLVFCYVAFLVLGIGCKGVDHVGTPDSTMHNTPAGKLLLSALAAHGGDQYETAHYMFSFRGKQYRFKNDGVSFRYEMSTTKDGKEVYDVLDNTGLKRTIDGQLQTLTTKQIDAYSEALNSVIYFATLPHKLQDPAVNLELMGQAAIKGKNYDLLGVTFDQEGGGKDFDDHFIYWINADTKRIDYLAYDYRVNNGGVRFRSAYNERVVDGILFQDYINYKAPVGTPLIDLPQWYEEDKLEQLSLILTEDVIRL